MALDKKSSIYSDHGTVGSAEELDTYGVWVKSEPQDMTAGLAEVSDYDTETIPYESIFEDDYEDLTVESNDFDTDEQDTSELDAGNFEEFQGDFEEDEEVENVDRSAPRSAAAEEVSTQLLMKIADELSSIRAELSTIKKEFSEIRGENVSIVKQEKEQEADHDFFTADDDDEKIALTGDEMEDFLASADFSAAEEEEEKSDYEAARAKDEAALKEISEQNESLTAPEEEIEIDFDDLGIQLDNEEVTAEEGELPVEDSAEILSLEDELPTADDNEEALFVDDDSSYSPEAAFLEEDKGDFAEELVPYEMSEQHEEIQALYQEGAIPYTPAPDNIDYLEEDPFVQSDLSDDDENDLHKETDSEVMVLSESALDETSPDEIPLEEISPLDEISMEEIHLEESVFEEPAVEEAVLEEPSAEDDMGFDLSLDDFSSDSLTLTDDEIGDVPVHEELSVISDINEEPISEILTLPDEADVPAEDEFSPSLTEDEIGEIPVDNSLSLLDMEEIQLDEEISSDDLDLTLSEEPINFDDDDNLTGPMIESSSLDTIDVIETTKEITIEETSITEETSIEEISGDISFDDLGTDNPISLAEEPIDDLTFDTSLDLSDAVIDEPDFSTGLVDVTPEEPVLESLSFDDDISLDMDDFGAGLDIEPENDGIVADSGIDIDDIGSSTVLDASDALDIQNEVVPEGFEIDAEEAAISVDDLEVLGDELSIEPFSDPPSGADTNFGISPSLKADLMNVLSYMDHLLESLPEDKIEEFAKSEHFDTYKKIFKELGLV